LDLRNLHSFPTRRSSDLEESKNLNPVPEVLIQAARELRQKQTTAESVLWEYLRDNQFANLKFRRQHPIKGTSYIADFYCNQAELDRKSTRLNSSHRTISY